MVNPVCQFTGAGSCGLNVHNAGAHLVDYVKGWGPLWAWSTFGFEDMNGTLMDFCHGTGNVCRQVNELLCFEFLNKDNEVERKKNAFNFHVK